MSHYSLNQLQLVTWLFESEKNDTLWLGMRIPELSPLGKCFYRFFLFTELNEVLFEPIKYIIIMILYPVLLLILNTYENN